MLKLYSPGQKECAVVGISAIASYQPEFVLPNAWYESLMARKFVKHTGIHARGIACESEVDLARRVIHRLSPKSHCDLADCAGLIFVSPSLIPQGVARRHLTTAQARQEQPNRLAWDLAEKLGIRARRIVGINGFCSGYARALELLRARVLPQVSLRENEFILVVTASRISRITDFQCKQSGALFGDFATVTLVSRMDSVKYPVHFALVDASYQRVPVPRAYFHFEMRKDVLVPTMDGGREVESQRVVFSLDGMGIADSAPRAMASAAASMASNHRLAPNEIDWIVPHQAGEGIVRLTGMKLEEAGFQTQPINGLTAQVGNVSSGSVPYALEQNWNSLHGNILCPVAAVGGPGKPEVSQGCVFLKAPAASKALAQ